MHPLAIIRPTPAPAARTTAGIGIATTAPIAVLVLAHCRCTIRGTDDLAILPVPELVPLTSVLAAAIVLDGDTPLAGVLFRCDHALDDEAGSELLDRFSAIPTVERALRDAPDAVLDIRRIDHPAAASRFPGRPDCARLLLDAMIAAAGRHRIAATDRAWQRWPVSVADPPA